MELNSRINTVDDCETIENIRAFIYKSCPSSSKCENKINNEQTITTKVQPFEGDKKLPLKGDINKTLHCQICSRQFSTKVELFRHMFMHRDKKFPCKLCHNFNLYTFISLRIHLMKKYSLSNCTTCDEVMEIQGENDHNANHTEEEKITFTYNDEVYVKKKETIRDIKIKKKDVSELIKCHLCDRRVPVQFHLKTRLLRDSHDRMYKCELCERSFKITCRKKFKNKNCKSSYAPTNKIAVYKCDLCNLTFCKLNMLNQHLDELHNDLNSFECKTCDVQFESLKFLKAHNRNKHGNNKRVDCAYCDNNFTSLGRLNQHIRVKHKDKVKL